MRAHTITTKASTIVPGGILALSLAVVLLAATASTASAAFFAHEGYRVGGFAPSFDFGDRQVGTTSPAERFTLRVADSSAFAPRISISGDYAQTK
jgi:hypothetical protein